MLHILRRIKLGGCSQLRRLNDGLSRAWWQKACVIGKIVVIHRRRVTFAVSLGSLDKFARNSLLCRFELLVLRKILLRWRLDKLVQLLAFSLQLVLVVLFLLDHLRLHLLLFSVREALYELAVLGDEFLHALFKKSDVLLHDRFL